MRTYKSFTVKIEDKDKSIDLKKMDGVESWHVFFDSVRLARFTDKAEADAYFDGLLDMARFTKTLKK